MPLPSPVASINSEAVIVKFPASPSPKVETLIKLSSVRDRLVVVILIPLVLPIPVGSI